ncbi:hypothetical protein PGT21_024202 [Puccinia graminis f. sp. tritici]|uniref:Uncharacterized protein n=1 Tax=Puccinia graminis f. sp. tritici TaxID=56615 RepID=A0A5B0Q697_PUCGR|nr:hypothetical protein PGT21_024202 [Puccinia graminis f. sp. tritici]
MVLKSCRVPDQIDDSCDKAFTSGLGLVVSVHKPEEIEDEENKTSKQSDLHIIVSHTDWDPIDRILKSFNVKYIIPGNPRLINTHSMIRSGRDFFFDGFLAGWDLKQRMAIIKVLAVSPVIPSTRTVNSKSTVFSPQTSPMNKGQKFVTFDESNDKSSPPRPIIPYTASSIPSRSTNQGEGTSTLAPPDQANDVVDEAALAIVPVGKGKAKASPTGTPPKKKRGPPAL